MSIDIDGSENSGRVLAGQYHVSIINWNDTFEKVDKVIAECEILDGTVPDQAGKVHTEFFAMSTGALPHLQACLEAVGVLKPDDKDKTIEPDDVIGGELVAVIEDNEYKGVTRSRIKFAQMFSVTHPDVSDVPKAIATTRTLPPLELQPGEIDYSDL